MFRTKIRGENIQFSEHVFRVAAMWWAQYLPGVKKVDFSEINQNSRLTGYVAIISEVTHEHIQSRSRAATEQQVNQFIDIVARKLAELARKPGQLKEYSKDLYHFQIGSRSDYHPPKMMEEALDEAKIKMPAFGSFPYKTEMKIYNNGQIMINDQVISTDPRYVHYTNHYDFSSAPYMKINGDKFRLLEINRAALKGELFTGFVNDLRPFKIDDTLEFGDEKENLDTSRVYITIHTRNFLGNEQGLLSLSDEDLINILQDEAMIIKYFAKDDCIYYKINKEKCLKATSYTGIGDVVVEQLAPNLYEYSTGPVQVFPAPSEGTVAGYEMAVVHVGDFLIYREANESVKVLPAEQNVFAARLCDKSGKILSEKIYRPGDALPLLPSAEAGNAMRLFAQSNASMDVNQVVQSPASAAKL